MLVRFVVLRLVDVAFVIVADVAKKLVEVAFVVVELVKSAFIEKSESKLPESADTRVE